jgi:transmembrane sensor
VKNKFLNHSLEQLLEEKSFVAWVLHHENNQEWEKFLENNPDFRVTANKARKIILLVRDHYEEMDEGSVFELWEKINSYHHSVVPKKKKISIPGKISWAASILLIISLGIFGYYYIANKKASYQFHSAIEPQAEDARMVLSTGKEIALKKDKSTITLDETANQVTVNDSIIDLTPESETGRQKVKMNEVVIPYGKTSDLLLADGTRVWLNAGSRIAFPSKFSQETREVYLEGEACFQVTRNQEQPFIVKTGEVHVKVLGTHFNISAYPADQTIETVLLEGSIALESPKKFGLSKKELIIQPNQKASYTKKFKEFKVTNEPDADMYIAWTYGWLKYHRESLGSVLKKVERYYNVEIQLPENYPGDDKISGKLDLKDSLEEVMIILADASEFNYSLREEKIIIEKRIKKIQQ